MNADRIWRETGQDALAGQIVADRYTTFVAMPFRDQFSYRATDVFDTIICEAVKRANEQGPARPFACPPVRADRLAPNASEITEEIVEHILADHFFVADLTMANHGVLVETGVALSLKPLSQIILIAQGDLRDLHFDIKDNRVVAYDQGDPIKRVSQALLEGATKFEGAIGERLANIRRSLSSRAVYLMNLYGRLRMSNPKFSLHEGLIAHDENLGKNADTRPLVFDGAVRELLTRGLLELDYRVADDGTNPDWHGLHATKLGLAFVRSTWPNAFGALT